MARFNDGIIFTNQNCIVCNKCISQCDILGANVSTIQNGKKLLCVNDKKCNHCGKCVNVCIHDARDFKDDTATFFDLLKSGEKLSLIIDQTFYVIFAEKAANVIWYLKSLGVEKIYDLAYGSEISLWAHVKYLSDNYSNLPENRAFIANTCSSFVNEVELYSPALRFKIIPVQSPLICTAIYAHKYLGDKNRIAFLSSCISKTDEIKCKETGHNVDFNLTYRHFMDYIDDSVLTSKTEKSDLSTNGIGNILGYEGSFKDTVARFFPSTERLISFKGTSKQVFSDLEYFSDGYGADCQPLFVEVSSCDYGCQRGPAFVKNKFDYSYIYSAFDKIYKKSISNFEYYDFDYQKNRDKLFTRFEELDFDDFKRDYVNRYHQQYNIPAEIFENIYSVLLKDTEEKRQINCGACGYSSCYEMAKAIACGYNRKENCLHYMNDLMEKNYYTDNLTGLDNQSGIIRKGNQIIEANPHKNYAVYAGDINGLKIINDIFGFDKGNEVLKYIAHVLTKTVGNKGVVGRIGGGLFCIIVEHTPESIKAIRAIKSFDCSHLGLQIPVSLRFGIYVSENEGLSFSDMLNYATLCMDCEASSTLNTFTYFTDEYRAKMFNEIEIASQLPSALKNDEFILYYQPQYKAGSKVLVGAEALCRWKKEDGSIVMPDSFIPIAEKNGFIVTLDKVIWRKAFSAVKNWIDEGIEPVPISINISRATVESDSFINTIKCLDEEFRIPRKLIHFEITESVSTRNTGELVEKINKIKEIGYKIAMDDFGSGYSSLNSLKDIPIDILKLDMGFFKSDNNMDKGGNVIASVVHMAQTLELITVAEGVETNAQANFLAGIGCDVIQGFLYSKPLSCEDFTELLRQEAIGYEISKPNILGQLNVNKFYNPNSSENLMFELFSGPAALFEYDDLDYRARLLRVNTQAVSLFDAEGLVISDISNNLRSYFSKSTRKEILSLMQQVITSKAEGSLVVECRGLNKKNPIWVKFHFWLLSSIVNKHTLYCRMEDFTEEKISQNNLAVANSQLGMVFEHSVVGIILFHLQVDKEHPLELFKLKVLKINSQFTEMSGFTQEDLQDWDEKEILSLIHPVYRPKVMTKIFFGYTKNFEKPVTCKYLARHKDGHYMKVQILIAGVKQENGSYFLSTNYFVLDDKMSDMEELLDNDPSATSI